MKGSSSSCCSIYRELDLNPLIIGELALGKRWTREIAVILEVFKTKTTRKNVCIGSILQRKARFSFTKQKTSMLWFDRKAYFENKVIAYASCVWNEKYVALKLRNLIMKFTFRDANCFEIDVELIGVHSG